MLSGSKIDEVRRDRVVSRANGISENVAFTRTDVFDIHEASREIRVPRLSSYRLIVVPAFPSRVLSLSLSSFFSKRDASFCSPGRLEPSFFRKITVNAKCKSPAVHAPHISRFIGACANEPVVIPLACSFEAFIGHESVLLARALINIYDPPCEGHCT